MPSSSSSLYLGIDTGGTFTDGVLLDPVTRTVVKSVKVLTTHHDLRICIAEVIKKLAAAADLQSITLVSLSTTLATNAIAEGKRKRVGLLLLGYDAGLVKKFGFQRQFGTEQYHFIEGRHGLDGVEQVALDQSDLTKTVQDIHGKVEAFAVSSYAGFRNASHEEHASEIISALTHLPVVQAHHLSSELDSIRRATTASLNASLLSNIHEFLEAVQVMLASSAIACPVMIVRSDGSIVNSEVARQKPVEIIHSGPATSAIGGQFLSKQDRALVIDVGGTTTDIALIDHGNVQIQDHAATVGDYRTCVRTIRVRSFGLGGDSLIKFDHNHSLDLGPERVIPISHLAYQYPEIKADLAEWLAQKKEIHYDEQVEYWVLRRPPTRPPSGVRQAKALELLRHGPMRLGKLLKQVGAVSPLQIGMEELINQEIIDRAGLTPTDLLHLTGEFAPWDREAAMMLTEAVAKNWGEGKEAFSLRVKDTITRRIVAEIIQFLSNRGLSGPTPGFKKNNLDRWLYEENLLPQDNHLGCQIFVKIPIVGIGAPARAFLPSVAAALGTQIIFPENYEVANAVGTVVSNIMIRFNGEVSPAVTGTAITGYFARAGSLQEKFITFPDALDYTRRMLIRLASEEAARAGATAPAVDFSLEEVIPNSMVKLSAWAVGRPGPV